MTRFAPWHWGILGLTLGLYAVLLGVQLLGLGAAFGDTLAPDSRVWGYDAMQVRAFLTAIGEDGQRIYFGLFRRLDLAFPALVALSIVLLFARYDSARGLRRWGLCFFALTYLVSDCLENHMLLGLRDFLQVPDVFEAKVRFAAAMTRIKFLSLLACGTLVYFAMRRARRQMKRSL